MFWRARNFAQSRQPAYADITSAWTQCLRAAFTSSSGLHSADVSVSAIAVSIVGKIALRCKKNICGLKICRNSYRQPQRPSFRSRVIRSFDVVTSALCRVSSSITCDNPILRCDAMIAASRHSTPFLRQRRQCWWKKGSSLTACLLCSWSIVSHRYSWEITPVPLEQRCT